MTPLASLLWAALGGLWALAGIAALRFATAPVRARRAARDERQRQVAAAALGQDDQFADVRPETEQDRAEAAAAVEALVADMAALAVAERELAGEVEGWLRDETEGIRPPVVPGPEDADR